MTETGRKKKKVMLSEWVLFGTGMWKRARIKIVSLKRVKTQSRHLKATPRPHHNLVKNYIFKAEDKSFLSS